MTRARSSARFDGLMLRRPTAYLADVILIAILASVLWVVLSLLTILSFGLLSPLQIAAMALLPLAYHTLFIGLRGATPGMRLLDVEIRDRDGARPQLVQALVATVIFYVSVGLTSFLILAIALLDDRSRTLHDMLSGTLAVRRSVSSRR